MPFKERIVSAFKVVFGYIKQFISKYPKLSVLIILALSALYLYINIEILHFTSSPKFCQNCHPEQKSGPLSEVYTWSKNIHAYAGVECLDCHGRPGFIGYMRAKMGGLYDVYAEFLKSKEYKLSVLQKASDPAYAGKLVPNETCLFCHSDEYNQNIRKSRWMTIGVKMRMMDGVKNPEFRTKMNMIDVLKDATRGDVEPNHKQHLDKGLTCMDCHLGVAHGGQKRNLTKMQTCFDCHDKARTPKMPKNEDCTSCHRQRERVMPTEPNIINKTGNPVSFDHNIHTKTMKCSVCHNSLFEMKKGSATVRYAEHLKSTLCFTCHNVVDPSSKTDCSLCHKKEIPAPSSPITYRVKGIDPVDFSHKLHSKLFSCDTCHNKLWPMQSGVIKMKMEDLYQGKYCGACHNGTLAFSSMDCAKCHVQKRSRQ